MRHTSSFCCLPRAVAGLALLLTTLAGCGDAAADAFLARVHVAKETGDGAGLQGDVDALLGEVAARFGLPARRTLQLRLVHRADAMASARRAYEADAPADAAPFADTLEAARMAWTGAYYRPDAPGSIFIYDDVPDEGWAGMLRHEMVHALQDQHGDLAAMEAKAEAEGPDAAWALLALLEGQAMYLMAPPWQLPATALRNHALLPAAIAQGAHAVGLQAWLPVHRRLANARAAHDAGVLSLAAQFLDFPYVAGEAFIAQLVRQLPHPEAPSVAQVLQATLRRPPRSTHQLLDVAHYRADAVLAPLALPEASAALAAAGVAVKPHAIGTFEAYLLGDALLDTPALRGAYRGGTGLEDAGGGPSPAVYVTTWRDAAAAQAYHDAAFFADTLVQSDALDGAAKATRQPGAFLRDPWAVRSYVDGRHVVVVRHDDVAAFTALRDALRYDLSTLNATDPTPPPRSRP